MAVTHKRDEPLHCSALIASILCAAIYDGLHTSATTGARSFFFCMVFNVVLSILVIKLLRIFTASFGKFTAYIFCLLFLIGIAQTISFTLNLWNKLYPGSSGWLILFFVLIAVWYPSTHAINSTGGILIWCVIFSFLLVLSGVWSQLSWQRLSFDMSLSMNNLALLRFRPEYLIIPYLQHEGQHIKDATIPLVDSMVRFLLIFFTELVFGSTLVQQLEHGELLRAWGMGIFSRCDALVMGVWLMLAMYRVLMLFHLMRYLRKNISMAGRKKNES